MITFTLPRTLQSDSVEMYIEGGCHWAGQARTHMQNNIHGIDLPSGADDGTHAGVGGGGRLTVPALCYGQWVLWVLC